jgi:hypothetical protein
MTRRVFTMLSLVVALVLGGVAFAFAGPGLDVGTQAVLAKPGKAKPNNNGNNGDKDEKKDKGNKGRGNGSGGQGSSVGGNPAGPAPSGPAVAQTGDTLGQVDVTPDTADDPFAGDNVVVVTDADGAPLFTVVVAPAVDAALESPVATDAVVAAYSLTVRNDGAAPLELDPGHFVIRDGEGFIYAPLEVDWFDDAILSGDTGEATLVFVLPAGSVPADVFYAPAGRLITLYTVGGVG